VSKLPQIPFDLTPSPTYSFDSLILSACNEDAVKTIHAWPNWPSSVLFLLGPKGSGKTHLGQAWTAKTSETFIDDASVMDESTLFAKLNLALNGQIRGLLLADSQAPKDWSIELPDLKSRLLNVPIVSLYDHDDKILDSIVRKLFEDRGRAVTSDLVSYLLKHCDRSVLALKDIVRDLDIAAQSQKKDLTKAFAARQLS